MGERQNNPDLPSTKNPSHPSISSPSASSSSRDSYTGEVSGKKPQFPNPPDAVNPDPVTLREQWRYATRQYSRWYAQAWGTAILAGLSFFAIGWLIKGSNPLPSRAHDDEDHRAPPYPGATGDVGPRN